MPCLCSFKQILWPLLSGVLRQITNFSWGFLIEGIASRLADTDPQGQLPEVLERFAKDTTEGYLQLTSFCCSR